MNWSKDFLKRLDKEVEEFKEDSVFLEAEGKNPDTMRFLFCIGDTTDNMAVMDVAVYQMESGVQMLQYYTVVVTDVADEALPTLMSHINKLNLPVPVGAFGYFEEEHQVYHKYSMIVEEPADMDTFVRHSASNIAFILNILDSCCEGLYGAAGQA